MPDADPAGQKYADAVKASLESEGIEYRVVTFGDVGAKDVTEFLDSGHSVKELVRRIGPGWVLMPDGTQVFAFGDYVPWPPSDGDVPIGEITA